MKLWLGVSICSSVWSTQTRAFAFHSRWALPSKLDQKKSSSLVATVLRLQKKNSRKARVSRFPSFEIKEEDLKGDGGNAFTDQKVIFYSIPFVAPFVGFMLYDPLSRTLHDAVINLGKQTWVSVDGGQYQSEIITPAINGIVVPTISIVLATLVTGTLAALRDRQNVIRSCLNKEACTIKMLQETLVHVCRDAAVSHRRNTLILLYRYVGRILEESVAATAEELLVSSRIEPRDLNPAESEMQALLEYFYILDEEGEGEPCVAANSIVSLLSQLNGHRCDRLTALQNVFPVIHWSVIALLGSSLLVCFLVATDQDAMRFLDGLQLRMLFGFLCGAVSSTALLCVDLSQPFTGFFCISHAMDPLIKLRRQLQRDLQTRVGVEPKNEEGGWF
uniref:Uncharacterized protein n=1 Tax=Chromera velia CCMP2878 TaxID=1169474 RepID=A0A0G4GCV0_9ALVE|eukprot:Cvel_21286.t1-p1 / transcript=Cvel_21286.t1 / gene=Cvel_21286 / organism=Chromera_velia_CCMP2878 / gene_product=hypothetical protein / transcript_product=hypothetical protein / location=Cvel_scaffold1982:14327-16338(+) / protein_length=389 / sequence_SO=supercontig / SO=protein_coding / is_pseudo=false